MKPFIDMLMKHEFFKIMFEKTGWNVLEVT